MTSFYDMDIFRIGIYMSFTQNLKIIAILIANSACFTAIHCMETNPMIDIRRATEEQKLSIVHNVAAALGLPRNSADHVLLKSIKLSAFEGDPENPTWIAGFLPSLHATHDIKTNSYYFHNLRMSMDMQSKVIYFHGLSDGSNTQSKVYMTTNEDGKLSYKGRLISAETKWKSGHLSDRVVYTYDNYNSMFLDDIFCAIDQLKS